MLEKSVSKRKCRSQSPNTPRKEVGPKGRESQIDETIDSTWDPMNSRAKTEERVWGLERAVARRNRLVCRRSKESKQRAYDQT